MCYWVMDERLLNTEEALLLLFKTLENSATKPELYSRKN